MIQRVQTLWMLLAAIAVFLTFQFPFYSGWLAAVTDPDSGVAAGGNYGEIFATQHFLILFLTSALGTGILINIFLFNHRKIQMRILLIGIIVECLIVFLYMREIKQFSTGNFSLWSGLHPFIIFLLFMAMRGIYKDGKLIKESNRLR